MQGEEPRLINIHKRTHLPISRQENHLQSTIHTRSHTPELLRNRPRYFIHPHLAENFIEDITPLANLPFTHLTYLNLSVNLISSLEAFRKMQLP